MIEGWHYGLVLFSKVIIIKFIILEILDLVMEKITVTLPRSMVWLMSQLLPIGAYEPRWFMKSSHQNPQEALTGLQLCKARYGLGHHWGTFQLTNEAVDAPKQALDAALKQQALDQDRFIALRPGQVWKLPT